jgi:leader peptidase (prepilin peptidase)/N-methyltransferase
LLFTLGFTTGYIDLSFLGLLVVFTIFVDEKYKEIPLWTNAAIFLWVITFGAEMLKINLLPALILVLILLLIYLFFLKVRNIEGIGFADIILLFSLALYLGFPNYLYLLTIASASLLLKIFLTKKYVEQHAFGSWIVGVFALFILFQEFYASASLNST